jgi:hypothetical protein
MRLYACLAVGVLWVGCGGGIDSGADGGPPPPPPCTGGTDKDGDGYGPGCPAGNDCDDADATVHPTAKESCDGKDNNCDGQIDEGVKNACGTCDSGCGSQGGGATPFPIDPSKDPNVKDANGIKLDPNGDIVLDAAAVNFNYLWIANTYDTGGGAAGCNYGGDGKTPPPNPAACRGTVSKVDTVKLVEAARYFTVTCASKSGPTGCADVNGKPINMAHVHTPSRTAVDFNFDGWVANRNVHGGQPSATKIANDPSDCIDRNGNGKIDTSKDQDGDGKITLDCNGDGQPDGAATACTVGALAGKPPEFLGDDDECILFTTNYAEPNDIGRSICLDTGKNNVGASMAWVGTFSRPDNGRGNNRFYGINGNTGKIEAEVEMPAGHRTYGCMADAHHIVWATDIYGSLTYFDTIKHVAGPLMRAPWYPKAGANYHHYGISINADQHVWLGGYDTYWVLRYKPDRTSFDTLAKGSWTRIDLPTGFITRGIAADNRGKVWVAIQDGGYIFRLNQSLKDGVHDLTGAKLNQDYWKLTANIVIGAGVDFNGNVWGIGHGNHTASRLDVDASGNVTSTTTKDVAVGQNPYTYSDFTGYGLMTFVRAQGRYVYQMKPPCPEGVKATWLGATWKATTPAGTSIGLRVRSGDSETAMGQWSKEFATSPAEFGPKSANPLSPNPAMYLQVEFTLKNQTKDTTPILHDYSVGFVCGNTPG